MGNCFGSSKSTDTEMGNAQSRGNSQASSYVSGLGKSKGSEKRSKKSLWSSESDNGLPTDIFADDIPTDKAKKIKIDPSQIDFGFKRQFHEEYEVTKLLGKGAFASAYQVTPRENSRFYGRYDLAVKVISKSSLKTVQDVRWLKQEIDIMRLVGGSINMVHVYECYESKNHVYLLMELCSGGNLFEKISKGDPYTEKMAAVLMGDILRVAEQCHSRNIIHRDIKPENFLFGNKLMGAPLKMTDFGLADYCKPTARLTEISGTPYYIAPEVIRQSYSLKADVWSCGVVLYVLLTGKTPFHREDDRKHSYKVVFRRILEEPIDFSKDPWPNISEDAKDLCGKLLCKNAAKRLTAAEALEHPWIQQGMVHSKEAEGTKNPKVTALVQRLQLFGTYSKFKQVALYRIAKELATPEVQEVKAQWDKMNFGNVEKMGTIRLLDGLELEGFTVGEAEGSDLLKAIDVYGKGGVSFEDYAAAIVDWREITKDNGYYHLCRQVFDEFDADKDGFITRKDLQEELPGSFTDKEVKKMIAEADTKGSGKIDFKDFVYFIQEKLGSADMFDKRLSSRYRNSFPKRTNSFLKKLNLGGNAPSSAGSSKNSMPATPKEGEDFNKSLRRDEEIADVQAFKEF
ncbi:calcium-dependent protein kinase [Chloropicon primus]|uniref:Calcium-dependent protein kinase n=1 Tax=Chloropicon primus TaxID=1764295 RepID=A0A5B8MTI9_9CHLO|nr:calcium-dependent protein kinase [Chloropicon primus]|eukprot:QDZ22740.1 calcium-dependent protein kinase [Chloropicon primus]